jgi:hypothetical protein
MPRTTIAVQALREARLPYIVVLTDPTNGGVTGPNGLAINAGGYSGEYTDAEVAEIVVFPRALTTAERWAVEGGLAAKWGLANTPSAITAKTPTTIRIITTK